LRQRFRTTQWLPHPVEFVFAFFANPANLPKLMPPWQSARIDEIELHPAPHRAYVDAAGAIAAGSGTRVTLSFRPTPLAPIRLAWEARIEDFHWNERFCDRQVRGPFRYWRQCHRVQPSQSEETGEHGTLLTDTVEYELPLGALGRLTNRIAVQRMLASTFRYRQQQAERLLRELSAGVGSHA
jgi:ligand-binding SRPBCC domain-containing protein